jgi:hypothetical protein
MNNNLNITIASEPKEELMQNFNKQLLQNKSKNDIITFDELEQCVIGAGWLNDYLFKPDKIQPFFDYSDMAFEKYILSSVWHPGEPEEIFNKLKYINRKRAYDKIIKSIGNNWKDKTIVDFGAGKGIHSWLLADLFKEVIAVEVISSDLSIALQMHKRLGVRSNVKFYLGDIMTCYDEIITKHKPDFLMFQIGYGFHHIKQNFSQTKQGKGTSSELAKSISDKYQIPFYYT